MGFLKREIMLQLEYIVNKPGDLVFDYLSDMQKFVSVHPIIYKIEDLGNNQYLVYERLKLLFVPYSFTYVATVENYKLQNRVSMSATVKRMVHVHMDFIIEDSGHSTRIKEIVQFRSLLPVQPLMKKIFREQHQLLFENIQKVEHIL